MDQIKIGKYIQSLRKEKGLTQKEIADKLGITFQAVSKWELGETLPDSSILLELCDILGTTADKLLNAGVYLLNNRRLMSVADVVKGFSAIDDVKKYFGEDSLFYVGMIEGINNKMNIDIQSYLKNPNTHQVLIAEVLLQGISSGKYFVDLAEVNQFFDNPKLISYITDSMNKI